MTPIEARKMGRLDDVIREVNCILGILLAYRDIVQTGDCNECAKKMGCEYVPKAGQVVRYNCPFFEREGE